MNHATLTIVATILVMLASPGLEHGIFEMLQGNAPAEGLNNQAIGQAQRMWNHGSEEALSLLPADLSTGIAAVTLSLALMVWLLGLYRVTFVPGSCYEFEYHEQGATDGRAL